MSQPTTRICTSCEEPKDLETDFHKRGRGFQNICKDCRNTSARGDYKSHGKTRKTLPKSVQSNNLPAVAERIVTLEAKLQSRARRWAHDGMEADDIYSAMVEAMLMKCKPEDTEAYFIQCAMWAAQAFVYSNVSYNQYVGEIDMDAEEVEASGFSFVNSRSVEDEIVLSESVSEFEAVIMSLSSENRSVIAMMKIGMSQREMAHFMHVTDQSMSERIKRIRAILDETLGGQELALAAV